MPEKKVFVVFATVSLPSKLDANGVTVEGRFVVGDDGMVTLTDKDGKPVRDQHGRTHERKPGANETPHQVAARLTKHFRRMLRGEDPERAAAKSPIKYPDIGVA